ncbi:MAG: proline dehydrogenase [Deltaproteobacteria bacterium]|nr:proline dehydrogenase [Deltaproteobacteria bacterium]
MFGALVARLLPLVPKPVVGMVARRYVAGEDLEAALAAVSALNGRGFKATLDILGENARDREAADSTLDGYLEILDRIADGPLESNISVKPTHLGLRVDAEGARERIFALAERARRTDNFVRIDMEDSSVTDATLEIRREADRRFSNCGAVLQAYLKRTVGDAAVLARDGANVRVCKGIYKEPADIAFHDKEEIRGSFLRTAEILMQGEGTYCAFATHDHELVQRLLRLIEKRGFPKDRCEFQVLLGVPVGSMLNDLSGLGFDVRVYVPFGKEWYPYATRRLKENPRLAAGIFKQMFMPERRL